jgi:hypothetical protein
MIGRSSSRDQTLITMDEPAIPLGKARACFDVLFFGSEEKVLLQNLGG